MNVVFIVVSAWVCFQLFLRIISIPGLQNKDFALQPFQLISPIKYHNLSVSPGHHQGTESVMNKV
jgi:hypothetical protein